MSNFRCVHQEGYHAHEFISEYTVEVITQQEAERRGRLHDKIKVSYLFDFNLEYVVDAARKSNKIRYMQTIPAKIPTVSQGCTEYKATTG